MNPRLLLGLFGLLLTGGSAAPPPGTTYDQRQEGKVNVQVDIKDVQIVALFDSDALDDYMNYDYAYDYSDFTIKPPSSKATTSKVSSTASAVSGTSSGTTEQSSLDSSSTKAPESAGSSEASDRDATVTMTPAPDKAMTTATGDNQSLAQIEHSTASSTAETTKIDEPKEQQTQLIIIGTTAASANGTSGGQLDGTKRPPGMAEPRKRCPVGFLLKSGRCFKRRLSLISPRRALFKLAPTFLNGAPMLNEQTTAAS